MKNVFAHTAWKANCNMFRWGGKPLPASTARPDPEVNIPALAIACSDKRRTALTRFIDEHGNAKNVTRTISGRGRLGPHEEFAGLLVAGQKVTRDADHWPTCRQGLMKRQDPTSSASAKRGHPDRHSSPSGKAFG